MSLFPEILGDPKRIDLQVFPPSHFVACLMQLPVMPSTERYGELIADLHPKRSGLGETQVMRIGGLTSADKTRLGRDELEMRFVSQPLGLGNSELAFVNRGWSRIQPVRDKRWSQRGLLLVGRIFSELIGHRGILAATVVARWAWNWRPIIGMKSNALYMLWQTRLEWHRWLN